MISLYTEKKHPDESVARQNMIMCQLETNGITDEAIKEAFAAVPRTLFLPDYLKSCAYVDKDIPLNVNRSLMEPRILAKMIQALKVAKNDNCLIVGAGSGYSTALLSFLGNTIIGLESDEVLLGHARQTLDSLSICNYVLIHQDITLLAPDHVPYDVILFDGAISQIPGQAANYLAKNGRLIAVVKEKPDSQGQVRLLAKNEENVISESVLFDASSNYLGEFKPANGFSF